MSEFNKALIIFFTGLLCVMLSFWAVYKVQANHEQAKANRATADACRAIVERSHK